MLETFVIVSDNNVISPILTTTREYGRWFEEIFDSSICQLELYLRSKKNTGESVLEMHPGTKIGEWFGRQSFEKTNLQSWFIYQDSAMMDKIRKFKLAEYRDAVPVTDDKVRMLRCYTLQQIELYIKSNVDRNFTINNLFAEPKQIKIRKSDFDKIMMPKIRKARKRLF